LKLILFFYLAWIETGQAKAMAGLLLEKQKLEGKLTEAAEFTKVVISPLFWL
jgi:hypothetical protein